MPVLLPILNQSENETSNNASSSVSGSQGQSRTQRRRECNEKSEQADSGIKTFTRIKFIILGEKIAKLLSQCLNHKGLFKYYVSEKTAVFEPPPPCHQL